MIYTNLYCNNFDINILVGICKKDEKSTDKMFSAKFGYYSCCYLVIVIPLQYFDYYAFACALS